MSEETTQEPAAPPKPRFEIAEGGVTINASLPTGAPPSIISRESIVETYGQNRR